MHIRAYSFHLLLACLLGVSLTACDQSSQKIDFESGSSLTVSGPSSLTIPNYDSSASAEYMVRAFTVEQDYEWSAEGASVDNTRRDGEVAVVSTSDPGTFTVSVTTTIDGEEYSGTASTEASYPSLLDQADKYNLSVFSSALTGTGLASGLSSGTTAFAPSNMAFLNALDDDESGQLEDSEMPAPGVLASVLQYHVAVDSLTSSEISDGDEVATALHPEETLTFNVNGGISVEGSQVVSPDIATSNGVVLHEIDGVLLPASVVSINDQTVIREGDSDAVEVEGTYVANGGFVALHEGSPSGEIIGVSDYLSAGFHGNEEPLEITLDSQLSDTTTVVAMPHRDTNGDEQFTFGTPTQSTDAPYFRGDSSVPVVDSARVATP